MRVLSIQEKVALVRNAGKAIFHVRDGDVWAAPTLCGERPKNPFHWYITSHMKAVEVLVLPPRYNEESTVCLPCREKLAAILKAGVSA